MVDDALALEGKGFKRVWLKRGRTWKAGEPILKWIWTSTPTRVSMISPVVCATPSDDYSALVIPGER
ncbi:hypothetical protein LNP74_32690 [Klebsiella pneumoniae subsp. pneumoniae]|nr:hypothetical protein [Klebsiella pneumoniae subsp. pneumoniae]